MQKRGTDAERLRCVNDELYWSRCGGPHRREVNLVFAMFRMLNTSMFVFPMFLLYYPYVKRLGLSKKDKRKIKSRAILLFVLKITQSHNVAKLRESG